MRLNIKKFEELTKAFTDVQLAKLMGISRNMIWRAKNGRNVGGKFISGFKATFPKAKLEDYFFTQVVE